MKAFCLRLERTKTSTISNIRLITLFLSRRKMKTSPTSNLQGCPSAAVVDIMVVAEHKLPPAQKHP